MIDVTVLADTHSLDAARQALRQHGIAHGLYADANVDLARPTQTAREVFGW